jgi:hypothetical protein
MQTIEATQFAIATHNGTITVSNPATGNYRTFRIRTQKPNARFAPGARIVSLLVGPDNTEDFRHFGFVTADGRVNVWERFKGQQYDRFARMLSNANNEAVKFGLVFQWKATCRKCGKALTDTESLRTGLGPTCRSK